jgi:hypothetical protein
MKFSSTLTRRRAGVLLPVASVLVWMAAACGAPRPVSKDFSAYCGATRIEVNEHGLRRISTVTDPERIKFACDFIKQYGQGWQSPRWQGGTPSRRRFDFWERDRYIGEFGINPNNLTTDNYYHDAPADEIAKLAAVFELEWPPQQ